MRLGAPIFESYNDPDAWVAAVQRRGYRAAYCPVKPGADEATIRAYARAAATADIVIAEVGAWSNPLSPDAETRAAAIARCQAALALADAIGAACCVNIAGSRGAKWDGPHPTDLTPETFDLIVETVRAIIDAVQPTRTFYTLEPMPWMYPDSADSYLALLRAIDRPRFAVHLDVVNLVNSPPRYFANAGLIRECVAKLGPWIKSCHAKDIILRDRLTVHLDEVRPGLGGLAYRTLLRELDTLGPDLPLMLEHLPGEEEYDQAAAYVRAVAQEVGVAL
ncbi:MAG: sugar phosphate isomerase/epimerase [Anaerolineae bacterium]|nr:sugar phosphate isomerase/epimerase [Anaerolineae bacterium]